MKSDACYKLIRCLVLDKVVLDVQFLQAFDYGCLESPENPHFSITVWIPKDIAINYKLKPEQSMHLLKLSYLNREERYRQHKLKGIIYSFICHYGCVDSNVQFY